MPLFLQERSQAFRELIVSLREISELLRAAPSDVEQMRSQKLAARANALHRGSVVLLSSHLERYIESLVVEAIDAINLVAPVVDVIPETLRLIQIDVPLRNAYETKDMIRKTGALKTFFNDFSWFWGDSQPCGRLSGEALVSGFDNPLPERIRRIFRYFDIDDVIGRAVSLDHSRDRRLLEIKVRELVEKRNAIAHTGMTADLTRQDVIDYLRCTRKLTRCIDIIVGQSVQKVIGDWPWDVIVTLGITR